MRRFLKFLLFVVSLPVLLIVGVFWTPPETLARMAERGAARFADTDIELKRLDVAWFDEGPGVALESFALPPSLLDGKSAEAVIDFSELLRAQLVIDHVELRDTAVNLVRGV